MAPGSASVPKACERCTSGASRGVAYTIRQGDQRLLLDHDAVIGRIQARELLGTEFVQSEDAPWLAIAEHPSFRHFFFPGTIATAPAAPRRSLNWAPVVKAAAALLVGAGAIAGTWWAQKELGGILPTSFGSGDVATAPGGGPLAVEGPAADSTMAQLNKRVGVVTESRQLMLAQAWTARFRGGEKGMEEAVAFAERAAVRVPDVETLGLLAMLYAEQRVEPDLRIALLKRARNLRPDHVAVVRAELAGAMAEGRKDDARASAVRCLQLDPMDTWCASYAIDLTEDQPDLVRMRAFDTLARSAPTGCGLVVRKSTTAAIDGASPDALDRVEAALKLMPGDPELSGYRGVLALRRGDLKTAIATARRLGDQTPVRLRLDLAAHDIGAGNASSAREWLAPLAAEEPDDAEDRFWLHLHSAQADYLEAIGNAERMRGAADAADAVLGDRPNDATAAQVRMLAALATGDLLGARKAWGNADTHGLPGPDVAQLLLTAVELDLAGQVAREAIPRLEAAQRADPASPAVWIWTARIALEAGDGNMAVQALRSAVAQVDGSAGRRNPLRFALGRPVDTARVEELLRARLTGAAGQEKGLAVGLATLQWLQGRNTEALNGIAKLARDGTDPEAQVLAARIYFAAGRPADALPLVEQAAAARPKESRFQLLRALCLQALGRAAEVEKALSYVKGGDPTPGYYLLLGELSTTDPVQRKRYAMDALALDPYSEDAVRLLQGE